MKETPRKLGIHYGNKVKVTSRRGSISLNARVTDRIKQGVVFIPFHFYEASANILTTTLSMLSQRYLNSKRARLKLRKHNVTKARDF